MVKDIGPVGDPRVGLPQGLHALGGEKGQVKT